MVLVTLFTHCIFMYRFIKLKIKLIVFCIIEINLKQYIRKNIFRAPYYLDQVVIAPSDPS